jgi:hypothetical protein
MGSSLRLLAAPFLVGTLVAASAFAGIPADPSLSTVPNVLYNPNGGIPYTVTVMSNAGPIEGSLVRIIFSDEVDQQVCWCPGQTHPVIEGTTDANGEVTFFIAAGGCLDPADYATPPVQVFADGVLLAEVGAVSPDAVDDAALLPFQGWNPGGFCNVSLTDAVFHTPPIKLGAYSFCTDFDSDGAVTLDDAVLVTAPIKRSDSCGP